ncbi:MAG: hypothetical protein ACTSPA_11695 [Promethearchaeota archaeon]
MISKVEAEEKLLKIYYDVKLDRYHKKNPTHANIDMFEETKDPNHLEHFYKVKDDELVIAMWANSYEHGIPFFAVNMARESAINWGDDILSKYRKLYLFLNSILPFVSLFISFSVRLHTPLGAIITTLIATGVLIYFLVLKINWKKRVVFRFRDFFKNTDIFLPEEKLNRYSKTHFSEIFLIINIIHGFTIFVLFLSWGIIFT